ncbi:hypothetical protein Tco_0308211 [Tanacetum coccineum]
MLHVVCSDCTIGPQCIDGEFAYVDMVNNADLKMIRLNTVYENDISSFLGYVHKQKMMYVYAKLVKTTEDTSDEDGEGDSEHDSEDGHCDANDIIDDEHLVDEVEVNMSAFNFQIKGEGEDGKLILFNH